MATGRPPTVATRRVHKILATTDPELLSADFIPVFGSVMLYGYKSFTDGIPDANVGDIYVGWDPAFLSVLIKPGAEEGVAIIASAGAGGLQKNLGELYIKGAIDDGVYVEFI